MNHRFTRVTKGVRMNYERSNLGELAGMYEVSRLSRPSPSLAEENTGEYRCGQINDPLFGEDFGQNSDQERLLEQWKSESMVGVYDDEEEDWEDDDEDDDDYESWDEYDDEDEETLDTDCDDHWDDERDIDWS